MQKITFQIENTSAHRQSACLVRIHRLPIILFIGDGDGFSLLSLFAYSFSAFGVCINPIEQTNNEEKKQPRSRNDSHQKTMQFEEIESPRKCGYFFRCTLFMPAKKRIVMTIINYNAKEPEPKRIWRKIIWRNESHRKWANSLVVIVFLLLLFVSFSAGCCWCVLEMGVRGEWLALRKCVVQIADSICWCHLSLCWLFTGLKDF